MRGTPRPGERAEPEPGEGALGDVAGIIADALDVQGDLHGRQDLAEVRCHRLAQCQQTQRLAVDILLQQIELMIRLYDLSGLYRIAPDDSLRRGLGLSFRHSRHTDDDVGDVFQLLPEGPDDVFIGSRGRHVPTFTVSRIVR